MAIPTVDLSPFLTGGDEDSRKKATDIIKEACLDYGFFQIINHSVPLHLINRSIQLSKAFFALPDQEKVEYSPGSAAPLPTGYSKQPANSLDKNEYLLMFEPQSSFNILPKNPPDLRNVLEEMFESFRKMGKLIEGIVNDCLGLPADFLTKYNDGRNSAVMVSLSYYPSTDNEKNGMKEHADASFMSLIIQDEVGGLEMKKDGKWIPIFPAQGTIFVNIGEVIQVLSNNKFMSPVHRVVRAKGKTRQSVAFFFNIDGEKWIEPLPQFTEEIGEAPKYRRFLYNEYLEMRTKNKTHPTPDAQDLISETHYAITN